DITGDANVSRLFSLGTGLFAGGKTNQALDSLDNVSSTVRRLNNLDNVTDVTKTLDDVTIKQPQKLKSVESYSNWDDMKSAHKGMVTKFVQNNKPKYSPNVKKWFEKDGSLVIETLEDNTQVWKYTNKAGDSVSYIPKIVNGEEVKVPDFSDYLHPNGDISRVNIGKFSGDRAKDIETFLNMTGLDEIPEGYTLHHGIPNGVVELVETEIHREFTHIGGFSLFK
ncbi:MAG: hypothetical protein UIM53_05770, partial [Acutalibacteraceae bacterium]|nr:hypothetical protein [Acutalibacteraceae bacterium]